MSMVYGTYISDIFWNSFFKIQVDQCINDLYYIQCVKFNVLLEHQDTNTQYTRDCNGSKGWADNWKLIGRSL